MSFEGILKLFDLVPRDIVVIPLTAVAFTIFIMLMRRHVIAPFQSLIEAREALTSGAVEDATAMEAEAARLREQTEEKLLAARVEFMKRRLLTIESGKVQAQRVISEAEIQGAKILAEGRAGLEQQRTQLREQLRVETHEITNALMERIFSEMKGHSGEATQ